MSKRQPLNILHADSAIMYGQAKAQQWAANFIRSWLAPLKEMQLMLWWEGQTPSTLEALKGAAPDAFAEVEKKVNQLQERRSKNGTS